jgi:hypothetical protein
VIKGSNQNQGSKKRREIVSVKEDENVLDHGRRSLMQVQVSLTAVVSSKVEDLPMPKRSSTFSLSVNMDAVARRVNATVWSSGAMPPPLSPPASLGLLAACAASQVCEGPPPPVVVIADGANWIRERTRAAFPAGHPHSGLAATVRARWGTLSERQHEPASLTQQQQDYQVWLHRSWLWQGGVDGAIQALRNLGTGLPAEPLETINGAITYLENQREWIGSYEQWHKMGYPVGSGMIERAVAIVINRRMKKRGMRWCRPNATAVVALRTDVQSAGLDSPSAIAFLSLAPPLVLGGIN